MSMWRPDTAKFLSLAASGALVACTHAPGPITMVKPAAFPVTVAPQTRLHRRLGVSQRHLRLALRAAA